MTPSCSPEDPIMTRTSRARIRPFTRICGCRLDQSPQRRSGSAPRAVLHYRNFRRQHSQTPEHSFFATAATHRNEVLALKFASRREVVGNNLALARSKSSRLGVDLRKITLPEGRQSALCAMRTQPHRLALNRLSLPMALV
jgi:hypothetical protein